MPIIAREGRDTGRSFQNSFLRIRAPPKFIVGTPMLSPGHTEPQAVTYTPSHLHQAGATLATQVVHLHGNVPSTGGRNLGNQVLAAPLPGRL